MTRHLLLMVFLIPLTMGLTWAAESEPDPWWLTPQRMIQTNLREIDATMDIDQYIRDIKAFGANVVLFNVGGIVANYPTKHSTHWKNTFMEGDLVGTVLDRLHQEGIRMIGRFDFSKVNEHYAKDHPEWLYVSEKGENVNYNGQVHTCASGPYQQEVMFEILGDAIDRFPQLDGVFFNMIGYPRSDYSRNYHGICQCDNCQVMFKKITDLMLPKTVDENDPAYQQYSTFVSTMKDKQFTKVQTFLKGRRPGLCICTYTTVGVDVIRKESNRPRGRWTYYDTMKAQWTLQTCGERQLANAAVHFMEIPYRHAAVSPYLNTRRLWQQMINGAWLDFYCIGPLQRQEDRTGLELLAGVYNFHKDHENVFKSTTSAAQIGLVQQNSDECLGIQQILAENQVVYEFCGVDASEWASYEVVIVPNAGRLNEAACKAIDEYIKEGGKVLMTQALPQGLACVGETKLLETRPREMGSYIRIRPEDKEILQQAELRLIDLVFLSGDFHVYSLDPSAEGYLRLIPQDMFGPPEKCYYRVVSDYPALFTQRFGKGQIACFPFEIGRHYQEQCHQGHAGLLLGALDKVLGLQRRLQMVTHRLVEASHQIDKEGSFEWVGLYNHSGHNLNAYHKPIPISDVQIVLNPHKKVVRARLLGNNQELKLSESKKTDTVSVFVPKLKHYDIVLFEYEDYQSSENEGL